MRLIDADRFRLLLHSAGYSGEGALVNLLDAAPTVDVPQPLTRDGVLAAVKAIEHAGGKAVVEMFSAYDGMWLVPAADWVEHWANPDVPRWNVRVRAVPVETETVPLADVIGRRLPHGPSCDPNPPIVDVKSGSRWGIDGWFWTGQSFPHDDATTTWTTLTVVDGRVEVLDKGEA